MEFLLECIGFPPDWDLARVAAEVRQHGESTAWRGPTGEHLRLPLTGGLELRLDQDEESEPSLWPFYSSNYRRRVAVNKLESVPDSTYDAILRGVTDPIAPIEHEANDWRLSDVEGLGRHAAGHQITTYLTDARRLPHSLPKGHVLAINIAGFALSIDYLGPNEGASDPEVLDSPHGAYLLPLGGADNPAACMEISMRIRSVTHMRNALTGNTVHRLELDAPGAPLEVFISPWQLERDDLPHPKPGARIEGVFLFVGRIVGGLPRTKQRRRVAFG
jgi:hypothetical protein